MNTYIALLRGINVSGQHIIKMVDLKDLFICLGFENVITYIQSGNIIFKSAILNKMEIITKITEGIKEKYNYTVPVLVLSKQEINFIFSSNIFLKRDGIDIKKLHVTVLDQLPSKDGIPLLNNYCTNKEEVIVKGNTIFSYFPNGVGRSKFTLNVIESKLKTKGTSRNWNTITKLVELSN